MKYIIYDLFISELANNFTTYKILQLCNDKTICFQVLTNN